MPTAAQIAHFKPRAVWLVSRLLADFPVLSPVDGFAIAGNGGHESKGFTDMQEDVPVVKGSRGGGYWFMWTGPRRRAYEAYCLRNGYDPASDEANYKWLFLELSGKAGPDYDESRAIGALLAAGTLAAKVNAFENSFERSGVPAHAARLAWAEIARDAWDEAQAAGTLPAAPEGAAGPIVEILPDIDPVKISDQLAALDAGRFEQITTAVALAVVKRAGLAATAPADGADTRKTTMNGTKSFLQSKTIWGLIIIAISAFSPAAGQLAGFFLPGDPASIDPAVADGVTMLVKSIMTAFGIGLSGVGRVTAKTGINLTGR